MRNGFKFKDKHTSDLGVTVRTMSRPIHPEVKKYEYETPLMDGNYDFSSVNDYGREFYKNRIFTVQMFVSADNLSVLQTKISRISTWLTGRGMLVFDDLPLVRWTAKVSNSIDYAPEHDGRKAVLAVTFEVQPFAMGFFDTSEGALIGDALQLESSLPIDINALSKFDGKSISYHCNVKNIGTWYCRPEIIITTDEIITAIWITVNNNINFKLIDIPEDKNVNKIIIDCANQTVTDGNGNNLLPFFVGRFFELQPGENDLWLRSNLFYFTVNVVYTPQFMYDFDVQGV